MLMHTLIPNVRLPINQLQGEISRVTVTEEELVVFLNSAFVLCWGSEPAVWLRVMEGMG